MYIYYIAYTVTGLYTYMHHLINGHSYKKRCYNNNNRIIFTALHTQICSDLKFFILIIICNCHARCSRNDAAKVGYLPHGGLMRLINYYRITLPPVCVQIPIVSASDNSLSLSTPGYVDALPTAVIDSVALL